MITSEQEDIICFFCHQSSFQYCDLQVYRLCPCSPSSPLICTYCCLSKEKLFCPECGMFFDKQILSQKASFLKNLEVKSKKISQFNNQYKNNMESQFFAQPIQNQPSINCQQYPNYQQMNFVNMQQQNYGQNFVNEMYQSEQELRSRINMKLAQTNPQLGISLANSLYQSPIKAQNSANSDFNFFDANIGSYVSSTNQTESNKLGQFSSQPSSQKSDWSQQKNIEQNLFCSIQSNCYKNQSNIDYFNQQNTINQPWIFNQQQQQLQQHQQQQIFQQNKQNKFKQNDKQFFTNIFDQPKTQREGFAGFPQNLQNQQQQIYQSFQNFQLPKINQQQMNFEGRDQNQIIKNDIKIEENQIIKQKQIQQQFQLSQQSTIIDEETVDKINNFSFQNSNTLLEQSSDSNYMNYLQKVPSTQKIQTHLHQSLDPSILQKQTIQYSQSLNNSQNSLKSSGFGQQADFVQPVGKKFQRMNRSNSVQMSQSLSLNDLADRSLNKSFSMQEKQKKQNRYERSYSNKDLAEYFKTSRSNQKFESKEEEPAINEQILQFKKEQEQMLLGRDFIIKSQQQQQINNQNFLNCQNKMQTMNNNNNVQMNKQLTLFGNFGNATNNNQIGQNIFSNNNNNNSNQNYLQGKNNMFAQYVNQTQAYQQPQIPFQNCNILRTQEIQKQQIDYSSPFTRVTNQNQAQIYNQSNQMQQHQFQQQQCMQASQKINFRLFSNNQMEEM
ncbi:hypothetical protein ABPG74_009078 [Tetrahymena malaccensis]